MEYYARACFLRLYLLLDALYLLLLALLAVGQRAYAMVRCPSCVRPSVRPCVNFFLNIFFSETTFQIGL